MRDSQGRSTDDEVLSENGNILDLLDNGNLSASKAGKQASDRLSLPWTEAFRAPLKTFGSFRRRSRTTKDSEDLIKASSTGTQPEVHQLNAQTVAAQEDFSSDKSTSPAAQEAAKSTAGVPSQQLQSQGSAKYPMVSFRAECWPLYSDASTPAQSGDISVAPLSGSMSRDSAPTESLEPPDSSISIAAGTVDVSAMQQHSTGVQAPSEMSDPADPDEAEPVSTDQAAAQQHMITSWPALASQVSTQVLLQDLKGPHLSTADSKRAADVMRRTDELLEQKPASKADEAHQFQARLTLHHADAADSSAFYQRPAKGCAHRLVIVHA